MAVAWFCLRSLEQHQDVVGPRLIILISTFVVAMFGDVYVATFQTSEVSQQGVNVALLPNLTFTVGMCLYFIFGYGVAKQSR
jgi:ABC-type Na+ efflux pump permease subunit